MIRARAFFIFILAVGGMALGWFVPVYSFAQLIIGFFIAISAIGIEFDLKEKP